MGGIDNGRATTTASPLDVDVDVDGKMLRTCGPSAPATKPPSNSNCRPAVELTRPKTAPAR